MSVRAALNMMLSIQSRDMTLERPDDNISVSIKAAPSNYSRNLQGPEETVMDGREFVISKDVLDGVNFPCPIKRGDRLVDADLGDNSITEVREMFDIGGAVIGYRVRTG